MPRIMLNLRVDSAVLKRVVDLFMSAQVWPSDVFVKRFFRKRDGSIIVTCTFNCRSVKSCQPEIYRLCDTHDFALLQQHWLLPSELDVLNNIYKDFLYHALYLLLILRLTSL